MDLVMMDIRERIITNDNDVETNTEVFDDIRSVAESTYVAMICD